jgi:hypothetical protein
VGFAGANCAVYLSDGRQILVTETRDEVLEKLRRSSSRWPTIELTEHGTGERRTPAAAHVVEPRTLQAE